MRDKSQLVISSYFLKSMLVTSKDNYDPLGEEFEKQGRENNESLQGSRRTQGYEAAKFWWEGAWLLTLVQLASGKAEPICTLGIRDSPSSPIIGVFGLLSFCCPGSY